MAVFNEDTRVKIPATIQFLRLDYHYQSLKADDIDCKKHDSAFKVFGYWFNIYRNIKEYCSKSKNIYS